MKDEGPGDLVLSRDERTGAQAYKPVVDTFVTRPDALYTVAYDRDGGGPLPPSEVVTTAPHPFYVSNRDGDGDGTLGGFVPASELVAGDELALADGSAAAVVGLDVEYAGAAGAFTTYNFEVADFHTYFVNADGVWVHNSGTTECARIFSFFQRVLRSLTPGDPVAAYKHVRTKLPTMTETAERGFVSDAIQKLDEMNADAAGPLDARIRKLGEDPDNPTVWKAGEVFAARRYEIRSGRTLRRPDPTVERERGADFVDASPLSGRLWQVKGPVPGDVDNHAWMGLLNQVEGWFDAPRAGEHLIVDVAGQTKLRKESARALLQRLNPAGDRYILLED